MIDSGVSSHILEVTKTSRTLNNASTLGTAQTADTLFLPSIHELGFTTEYESGPAYSDVFTDDESRRRRPYNFGTGTSNEMWWTRSAGTSYYCFTAIYGVHNYTEDNVTKTSQGGEMVNDNNMNSRYFPICFCT
jgi:hypothetical protein